MKNDLRPSGQILTAAFLPVGILTVLAGITLWLGYGWLQDANAAFGNAHRSNIEATETTKKVSDLRANKARVDQSWLELSAGTVRPSSANSPGGVISTSGPNVNIGDVPLNRGAVATGGFGAVTRPRELPESLSALAEAEFVILPQQNPSDRKFRRYAVGSDKIEFGRLLPLLASVESRFPLALVEEALFSLPASAPAFGTQPHALDSRFVLRLPQYDPSARAQEMRSRQKSAAKPGVPPAAPAKS